MKRIISKTAQVYDLIEQIQNEGKLVNLKEVAKEIGISKWSVDTMIKRMRVQGNIARENRNVPYQMIRRPDEVDARTPWPDEVVTYAVHLYRDEGLKSEEVAEIIQEKYGRRCTKNTVFNWARRKRGSRNKVLKMSGNPWKDAQRIAKGEFTDSLIQAGLHLEKCGEPQWMIDAALMSAWTTGGVFCKPTIIKAKRKEAA